MHEAARRQILKAEAYLLHIKRRLSASKLIGCVEGCDEEVVGGQGARNDLPGAVTNQARTRLGSSKSVTGADPGSARRTGPSPPRGR